MTSVTLSEEVTEELVEERRPSITWLEPHRVMAICRWLVRHEPWAATRDQPPFNASTWGSVADLCLWDMPTPGGHAYSPGVTTMKFWRSGLVVLTGPRRVEAMDRLAKLRASSIADDEDASLMNNIVAINNLPGVLRD